MTRDDIIRMAREACIELPNGPFPAVGAFTLPDLIHFAALIAAHEREQCAQVCEMTYEGAFEGTRLCYDTPQECAVAIRARREKK